MPELGIKDMRTFGKWCSKNRITIFNNDGGRYVYSEEFHFKLMEPIMTEMKRKYPNYDENYFSDELLKLTPAINRTVVVKKNHPKSYAPKGKNETKYLDKLMGKISKN